MCAKINICPNATTCVLYTGMLAGKDMFIDFYKSTYCNTDETVYKTCKRYIIKDIYGKCPPDLLPNSSLSTEQIAEKYMLTLL